MTDEQGTPNFGSVAEQYARKAMNTPASVSSSKTEEKIAYALTSIAASLIYSNEEVDEVAATMETEAYNRGFQNATLHDREQLLNAEVGSVVVLEALRGLMDEAAPDQPEDKIRQIRAVMRGQEHPAATPEEPEPGRDWSRVEAHVFKNSGKWRYQVFLDYTGLRYRGVQGEGPSGWHYEGSQLARMALQAATLNNTSGVSFTEIPSGWFMFVQNPPGGYPVMVTGGQG